MKEEKDGFKYFLTEEERISKRTDNKRRTRKAIYIFLADILIIFLVYALVYRPYVEKIEKRIEQKKRSFIYNELIFNYAVFSKDNNLMIDVYIKNNSENSVFIDTKKFYLMVVSPEFKMKIFTNFKSKSLKQGQSSHFPFFIEKSFFVKNKKFYIIIFFDNNKIFETEYFDINNID